ncbi:MAG: hypothetical protein NTX27_10045 [Verrucomicrobia bacterium]|nr:hypothetical protein [Verrucomicrobiota bacterium]
MLEEMQLGHLAIRDFDFCGVELGVEAAVDSQAGFCFDVSDKADDGGVVDQGLTSPVFADFAKEAVLNGIPL